MIVSGKSYASGRHLLLLTIVAGVSCAFPPVEAPAEDACAKLVADVVRHELDTAPSQGRWMYSAEYDKDGVKHLTRKIETDDGNVSWDMARNGSPLTDQERTAQREELDSLISSPERLDRNRRAMREDYARINRLLANLPTSVQFHCISVEHGTQTVRFEPIPDYSPWNVEQRVIAGMTGTLTLNTGEMRLLTAEGALAQDRSMFLGLGRIYKGSSVSFKREAMPSGAWETTRVATHIKGQILFFKAIAQDRHEARSDFCRVPKGLTASDALSYLTNPVCPSS